MSRFSARHRGTAASSVFRRQHLDALIGIWVMPSCPLFAAILSVYRGAHSVLTVALRPSSAFPGIPNQTGNNRPAHRLDVGSLGGSCPYPLSPTIWRSVDLSRRELVKAMESLYWLCRYGRFLLGGERIWFSYRK